MKASELIALLDGRAADDAEAIAELQRVIDEQGIDAATNYWLHG